MRRTTARRVARKNKRRAKRTKTVARSTVRKQLLGMAETKTRYMQLSGGSLDNTPYYENLNYWISQGVGDMQRIGDKIYVKSITFKFNLLDNPAIVSDGPIHMKIWLIESPNKEHAGILAPTFSAWGGPSILKLGNNYTQADMNTEMYSFIKTKKVTFAENNLSGTQRWKQVSMTHRVNGNWRYDGDNSGYRKNKQLYMFYAVQNSGAGIGNLLNVTCEVKISFKDL